MLSHQNEMVVLWWGCVWFDLLAMTDDLYTYAPRAEIACINPKTPARVMLQLRNPPARPAFALV